MGFLKDWLMKGVDIEEDDSLTLTKTVTMEAPPVQHQGDIASLQELKRLAEREQENSVNLSAQQAIATAAEPVAAPFATPATAAPIMPEQAINNATKKQEFKIIKVGSNKDIQSAIVQLQHANPCVVNFMRLTKREQAKLMDYLNGAVFALNATIYPLKERSYIVTPQNIEVKQQDRLKKR